MIIVTVISPWIKYPGGGERKITKRGEVAEKDGAAREQGARRTAGKAAGGPDKKGLEEEEPPALPTGAPSGGGQSVPFDTQPGRQVGPVAVGDVRVVLEGHRDLLVGVEADASGHQDRPVLVAAQLDIMCAFQQLLMHPSRPPPLPKRGAHPGPASPGRGLRRRRSPRPGARGHRARSYGPAATQARLRELSVHRRQRPGGPGGVAALSDVSTPLRAPPLGPGFDRCGWRLEGAWLGSVGGVVMKERGRGQGPRGRAFVPGRWVSVGAPLPERVGAAGRVYISMTRVQNCIASTAGFFLFCV